MHRVRLLTVTAALSVGLAAVALWRYGPPSGERPEPVAATSPEARAITQLIGELAQKGAGQLDAYLEGPARAQDRRAIAELAGRLAPPATWAVESISCQGDIFVAVVRVESGGAAAWPSVVIVRGEAGLQLRSVRW